MFSEAISSIFSCWRLSSASTAAANSGSASWRSRVKKPDSVAYVFSETPVMPAPTNPKLLWTCVSPLPNLGRKHDKSWCRAHKNLALAMGSFSAHEVEECSGNAAAGLKLSLSYETDGARPKVVCDQLEFR